MAHMQDTAMELVIQNVENLTLDGSAEGLEDTIASVFAQGTSYTVADVDTDGEEYTGGDWDGPEARANAPNPSDDDTDLSTLRDMFLVYPTEGENVDNKSEYLFPFRQTPDGPIHTGAITAIIQSINGARGGPEGVPEDVLQDAYNAAVRMGVDGGLYDDRDDAPDFAASEGTGLNLPDEVTEGLTPFTRDLWAALLSKAGVSIETVAAEWNPALHPRGPDGKFVERPWDIPDALDGADAETVIAELSDADPDFSEKVDGLTVDGVDVDEYVSENSPDDGDDVGLTANLEEKSTDELEDLADYLRDQHEAAREARDPGRQRDDTHMDELMKDTMSKIMSIDRELQRRDAGSDNPDPLETDSDPVNVSHNWNHDTRSGQHGTIHNWNVPGGETGITLIPKRDGVYDVSVSNVETLERYELMSRTDGANAMAFVSRFLSEYDSDEFDISDESRISIRDELIRPEDRMAGEAAGTAFRATVSAGSVGDADDMTGVVWAAGDHIMHVNGQPTPVHVPPDSIPRTFENVQERVSAEEYPTIGLDHGDNLHKDTVPIAAELDKLTIGQATDFELVDNGEAIAMSGYELTDDDARAAAEDGVFSDKDYSIQGGLRIHTDDDGTPKTVNSGGKERLVVTAEDVRYVDVVKNGAVDGAGPGTMPPVQTAASLAAQSPAEPATAYTATLRFAAKRADNRNMETLNDLEDLDDPDAILDGAASVVEAKDEQIEALHATLSAAGVDPDDVDPDSVDDVKATLSAQQAKAEAADTLAEYHDVDLAAEDGTQRLIDEHTEDLRRDVAAKEASLPSYDTTEDSIKERAEELSGKSPNELAAMQGERANEILQSEQARAEYGKAHAAGDGVGESAGAASGGTDDEADELAREAMTLDDKEKFAASDVDSEAEFMENEYGEDPADFVGEGSTAYIAATAPEGES